MKQKNNLTPLIVMQPRPVAQVLTGTQYSPVVRRFAAGESLERIAKSERRGHLHVQTEIREKLRELLGTQKEAA